MVMEPHQPERNAPPGWPGAQAGPGWSAPGHAGGWQPAGGQPYGPAPTGGPAQPYGPVPPGAGGYPPPPRPPRRSSGTTLAVVGVVFIVVVGAIAAAGIFLYSRSGGAESSSASGAPAVPAPPAPPAGGSDSASVVGAWKGTYNCGQGVTTLNLTIVESPASGGLRAIFRFSPDASNPSVPSGSYAMRGSLTGGSLELEGDRWIRRPAGYQMVGLSAQIPDGRPTRIDGTVNGAGCSSFTVERP